MTARTIPSGQEALVRRMLAPDRLPPGWRFLGAQVQPEYIVARYQDAAGPLAIRLGHRDAGGTPATEAFAVRASRTDPAARALLEAVLESVRDQEAAFVWGTGPADDDGEAHHTGHPDVECRAFEAGVKPAIRGTVAKEKVARVTRRYQRVGARVARSKPVHLRGEEVVLVYAARTQAEADALRDLEAEIFEAPGSAAGTDAVPGTTRELGARLGYPPCCVQAFTDRYARLARLPADGPDAAPHDTWQWAADAWVPSPRPRLNALVLAWPTLVSFEPCRFDCERALAIADATAEALAVTEPDFAAELDAVLARPVAIAADGARAWVALARGRPTTIAGAVPMEILGGVFRPEDEAFAAALVGREVDDEGRVAGFGDRLRAPVVVDFGQGAAVGGAAAPGAPSTGR